jgi:hypothetical protein
MRAAKRRRSQNTIYTNDEHYAIGDLAACLARRQVSRDLGYACSHSVAGEKPEDVHFDTYLLLSLDPHVSEYDM